MTGERSRRGTTRWLAAMQQRLLAFEHDFPTRMARAARPCVALARGGGESAAVMWPSFVVEGRRRRRDTVSQMVNDPFRALSHPIRRGIVERLAEGSATVGDATGGFGVSKPAISKHLKVLEETGVVRRVVDGRTHRLSLEPDVLSEAADWMDRQRALWGRLFDVVDEYLKEEASP
jgi:DNA-binding transcriptional ArsR family regulator